MLGGSTQRTRIASIGIQFTFRAKLFQAKAISTAACEASLPQQIHCVICISVFPDALKCGLLQAGCEPWRAVGSRTKQMCHARGTFECRFDRSTYVPSDCFSMIFLTSSMSEHICWATSEQEIILISVRDTVLEISCVRVFGFLHYSGWSRVDLHAQPGRSISWLPPPQSSPPGAVVHVRLI